MATPLTLADLVVRPDEPVATSDWLEVTQSQIDAFATVTRDEQWIHTDPVRAAQSPFGTTIAHGFLTLSLLTHLSASIPTPAERYDGILMGINYGFDKVRFVTPVKVGSRIRAKAVLASVDLKDANNLQVVRTFTVEIDGEPKPALVADWISRLVYG